MMRGVLDCLQSLRMSLRKAASIATVVEMAGMVFVLASNYHWDTDSAWCVSHGRVCKYCPTETQEQARSSQRDGWRAVHRFMRQNCTNGSWPRRSSHRLLSSHVRRVGWLCLVH